MRLQLYDIIPRLKPYIKVICTMNCDQDAETTPIRVLPDTCVELFMNYTNTLVAIIGNELQERSIITARMNAILLARWYMHNTSYIDVRFVQFGTIGFTQICGYKTLTICEK